MTNDAKTADRNALLQQSKDRLFNFEAEMEEHIEAIRQLIEDNVAEAGSIQALSQKLTLINALQNLDNALNGTEEYDMIASEATLVAQLEDYCQTHNLPLMSADELRMEPVVRDNPELGHDDWLEYFIERWNASV